MHDTSLSGMSNSSGNLLPSLTSLRSAAAIAVVIHHTRLHWKHFAPIEWIGHAGWLGVSFFFILSGFVLMWSFDSNISNKQYILRRLARIYPLHFACLIFSLLAFVIIGSPFGGYVGTPIGTIANFLLVHDWVPGYPNVRQAWNGVSWSLSCEFFFYLIAPYIFKRFFTYPLKCLYFCILFWGIIIITSCISQFMSWSETNSFLIYYPLPRLLEFLLGATGAQFIKQGIRLRFLSIGLAIFIIPIAIYCFLIPETMWCSTIINALAIPGLLWIIMAAANADLMRKKLWFNYKWILLLGEASFALYMTHALLLDIFDYFFHKMFATANSSALIGDMGTAIFLTMAIVLSIYVHLYFEAPMRRICMKYIKSFN